MALNRLTQQNLMHGKHDKESDEDGEAEDDYMSMSFAEPIEKKVETSLQRRAREKKEAEIKSRPKSKAEMAAEEAYTREVALSTSLDPSNKGFKMMTRLGFKGGALGKDGKADAITKPIGVEMKEGRGGIGLDTERKRKLREELGVKTKRIKESEDDFKERMRADNEAKRLEGQVFGAMVIAEKLDEDDSKGGSDVKRGTQISEAESKPLKSINVLWRSLVRQRLERERDCKRRNRFDLCLSRSSENFEEDSDDGTLVDPDMTLFDEETQLEEDDDELDDFNALEPAERLTKIVIHLRNRHNYCFWCKHQYEDSGMIECPGDSEAAHD